MKYLLSIFVLLVAATAGCARRKDSPGENASSPGSHGSSHQGELKGFVFIDGKYVDAPYRVTLDKGHLLINGIRIRRLTDWPIVGEDPRKPQIPAELLQNAKSFDDLLIPEAKDAWHSRMARWIARNAPSAAEREAELKRFYESLPFVDTVVFPTRGTVNITLKNGDVQVFGLDSVGPPWTKDRILKSMATGRKTLAERLARGGVYFFFKKGPDVSFGRHKAAEDLKLAVEILESGRTEKEKRKLLARMAVIPDMDPRHTQSLFSEFRGSRQLKKRIRRQEAVTGIRPRSLADIPRISPTETERLKIQAAIAAKTARKPVIINGIYSTRSPGSRGSALGRYGGGGHTERAVMRCLRWFKKIQNDDGSWGGRDEPKPVATGLVLVTFLAHGETPAAPEFGKTIEKGMKFLMSLQNPDGTFKETEKDPALQHAVATLALCDSYNMTKAPMIKSVCVRAIPVISKGQNPSGLWGMQYGKEDDLESSIWQILALKSAILAGLDRDTTATVLRKGIEALKKPTETGNDNTIGPAVWCLQATGYRRDSSYQSGIRRLAGLTADWKEPALENPIYHWQFITQARFGEGGETWRKWNKHFSLMLVKHQQVIPAVIKPPHGRLLDCGYWTSPGKNERYGKVYASALCCLALEVYYRWKPTYSRSIDAIRAKREADPASDLDIEVSLED